MSKRAGGKECGLGNPKKQKRDEELPTVTSGKPFGEATKYNSFKFTIQGNSVYVNPNFLAGVSPFFEALCLGRFLEGHKGEAELKEVDYDDVIELLNVLGADRDNDRKEIDHFNCASMLQLADKWQLNVVHKRCIAFLENRLQEVFTNFATTLQLLLTCETLNIQSAKAVRNVASRLAVFGAAALFEKDVHKQIKDPVLCSAIFFTAKQWRQGGEDLHALTGHSSAGALVADSVCYVTGCGKSLVKQCTDCNVYTCEPHTLYSCTAKLINAVQIKQNAVLDERFFAKKASDQPVE